MGSAHGVLGDFLQEAEAAGDLLQAEDMGNLLWAEGMGDLLQGKGMGVQAQAGDHEVENGWVDSFDSEIETNSSHWSQ